MSASSEHTLKIQLHEFIELNKALREENEEAEKFLRRTHAFTLKNKVASKEREIEQLKEKILSKLDQLENPGAGKGNADQRSNLLKGILAGKVLKKRGDVEFNDTEDNESEDKQLLIKEMRQVQERLKAGGKIKTNKSAEAVAGEKERLEKKLSSAKATFATLTTRNRKIKGQMTKAAEQYYESIIQIQDEILQSLNKTFDEVKDLEENLSQEVKEALDIPSPTEIPSSDESSRSSLNNSSDESSPSLTPPPEPLVPNAPPLVPNAPPLVPNAPPLVPNAPPLVPNAPPLVPNAPPLVPNAPPLASNDTSMASSMAAASPASAQSNLDTQRLREQKDRALKEKLQERQKKADELGIYHSEISIALYNALLADKYPKKAPLKQDDINAQLYNMLSEQEKDDFYKLIEKGVEATRAQRAGKVENAENSKEYSAFLAQKEMENPYLTAQAKKYYSELSSDKRRALNETYAKFSELKEKEKYEIMQRFSEEKAARQRADAEARRIQREKVLKAIEKDLMPDYSSFSASSAGKLIDSREEFYDNVGKILARIRNGHKINIKQKPIKVTLPHTPHDTRKTEDFENFIGAVQAGDLALVSNSIESFDVNIKTKSVQTALHFASVSGNNKLEMVKLLLKAKADPHAEDGLNWTPVDYAIYSKNKEVLKLYNTLGLLTDKHFDFINTINSARDIVNEKSIMEMREILEEVTGRKAPAFFIDMPKKIIDKEFEQAIRDGDVAYIKQNINRLQINTPNSSQQYPLHFASISGKNSAEIIDIFLANGADPNVQDGIGWTPIHTAIHSKNIEACQLYYDKKLIKQIHADFAASLGKEYAELAEIEEQSLQPPFSGLSSPSPLHFSYQGAPQKAIDSQFEQAIRGGDVAYVKQNINSLQVNTPNSSQQYPLHFASVTAKNSAEIIEILLANGADPNVQDGIGWTPIHTAIHSKNLEGCQIYLNKGLINQTHIDFAKSLGKGYEEFAMKLNNATPMLGATSVHFIYNNSAKKVIDYDFERAIHEGNIEYIKQNLKDLLLNASNASQQYPLHFASVKGEKSAEMIELFLASGADPNVKDGIGWTPIHTAIHSKNIEGCQLFLDKGLINQTHIDFAKSLGAEYSEALEKMKKNVQP